MKKNSLVILIAATLISLFSCKQNSNTGSGNSKPDSTNNSSKAKPSAAGSSDTTYDCDYYVDKGEADLMINKYNSTFDKNGLTKQFWIEACVLRSIHSFLNAADNSDFDGVRFFLGAKRSFPVAKSILMLTPTTPATSSLLQEKHINQWGVNIPLSSCTPTQLTMNLSYDDAVDKINFFGKKFRNESVEGQRYPAGTDPLSVGIWISKCKINKLMELYTPGNNLDGLMAISAAYYQDDERRRHGERKYIVQSTFVFVPTQAGVVNWTIVTPPAKWKDNGGFNHGQLCPQICD